MGRKQVWCAEAKVNEFVRDGICGMARKYVLSFLDQGLLSAFNFALGFVLIRTWQPEEFGVFAFWQTVALFCVGIQNALVNTPFSVFVPTCETDSEREGAERMLSSVNVRLIAVLVGSVAAANLLFPLAGSVSPAVTAAVAAYVGGMLLREYARGVGFGRQRPETALRADVVHLVIACSILVFYALDAAPLDLALVLGLLALGNAIGGGAGIVMEGRGSILAFDGFSRRAYGPIWKESKWALTGVVTTELQARGYVYLVTALVGLHALGILAAGRILFAPIRVLLSAWGRVARPYLAQAAAEGRRAAIARTVLVACVVVVFALLALYLLIYLAWPLIQGYLYRQKYDDIGWIVAGWGAVVLVSSIRSIFSITLQSFKKFRPLAIATVHGAVVSMVSVAVIVPVFGFEMTFVGVALGEAVALTAIVARFVGEFRSLGKAKA